MTMRSTDYAALSDASYADPKSGHALTIDGAEYNAIDSQDSKLNGFQTTAFQRADTGEVVIAYRGTEFDRQPFRDGVVDVLMVAGGINAQMRNAEAFTSRIIAKAEAEAKANNDVPRVTVTGHSLGGTLAEINAARFGLKGETFNAYGAAGLGLKIPEGGHQVVNHVRAGDPVSAASPHFGEVRVYAAQRDVDTLWIAGYGDEQGFRNLRTVMAIDFDSHKVKNFVPNNEYLGQSILDPENEIRYRANHELIDRYRADVADIRKHASVVWETRQHVIDGMDRSAHHVVDTARHVGTRVGQGAHEAARIAGDVIDRGNAASRLAMETRRHPSAVMHHEPPPKPVRLDVAMHPDHDLFQQARKAVHQLDAQNGRTPDRLSENLAGHLTVAARREGMTGIDRVVLSDDANRAYAIQGELNSPFKRVAEVPTELGIGASIEQSSAAWQTVNAQQQAQTQAHAMPSLQPDVLAPQQPSGPRMGM